jgi:predicted molibdopterin-dependent oxidoreductase YjgC
MVREAIAPYGESIRDWEILTRLATLILENRQPLIGSHSSWDYRDTSQIMTEAAFLTPIYAEVSHEKVEASGSLFWSADVYGHAELKQDLQTGEKMYRFMT